MTCARPRCNATSSKHFPHTSHCTPHFTLALHLSSSHLSSSHPVSCLPICQLSYSWLFSCQLLPSTDVYYKSSQKPLPSTTLYYEACTKNTSQYYFCTTKACTKHFPVLLCTTKLAQSTSQYYFVLQSLHKALPSTTLYYKASTKHFPVLLCTTKLAKSTSQYYFVLQSLQKVLPQYYFVIQSLHKASQYFFPTSLCGVLVFRPAAASLTHLSHHTPLITALLITHSSQHYSSHHLSITPRRHITVPLITPLVNHTTLSCGRRSTQSVAGAVHRASWRSCCARGRRLARGWRSCGRRSTQGLLEELLRAWSPPGPRLAFRWQVEYTEPAAARVVAAWPAAGFRVAGALHRA